LSRTYLAFPVRRKCHMIVLGNGSKATDRPTVLFMGVCKE
jgi:hypothetical protein